MMVKLGIKSTFDAAHRLVGHGGKCYNLHGHTYGVEVLITGEESGGGMLLDFGVLKSRVGAVLDVWDHAVILAEDDPLLNLLLDSDLGLCIVRMKDEPTVEHIVELIAIGVRQRLAEFPMVEVVSTRVYETPTCWAEL